MLFSLFICAYKRAKYVYTWIMMMMAVLVVMIINIVKTQKHLNSLLESIQLLCTYARKSIKGLKERREGGTKLLRIFINNKDKLDTYNKKIGAKLWYNNYLLNCILLLFCKLLLAFYCLLYFISHLKLILLNVLLTGEKYVLAWLEFPPLCMNRWKTF